MPFFDSRKSIKQTLILLIGRGGIVAGQLIATKVYTRLLSPVQLGTFYYVASFLGILSSLVFQPVVVFITRSYLLWEKRRVDVGNLRSLLKGMLALAVLACTGFLAFALAHGPAGGLGITWFSLLPTIQLTELVISCGTSILLLKEARSLAIGISNAVLWLTFLLTALLVYSVNATAQMMFAGQICAQLLIAVSVCVILLRMQKHAETDQHRLNLRWKEIWSFAWPVSITQGLFWAQNVGYRIPLKANAGEHELGIFGIVFGMTVGLFAAFQSVFTQLYDPIFWASVSNSGHHSSDLNAYLRNHWPNLILFTFLVASISDVTLRLITNERYAAYSYLMVLVAVAELIRHMGLGFYNTTYALEQPRQLLGPGLISFVVCLAGSYLLGRVMNPVIATILSLTMAYACNLGVLFLSVGRGVQVRLPLRASCVAVILGVCLVGVAKAIGLHPMGSSIMWQGVTLGVAGSCFICGSYIISKVSANLEGYI
jgi:O-antigen/teichoic acid export membrane protein